MPNWSQLSGAVDRVLLITLSYFVGKGYISQGDAATLVGGLVAVLGVAYSMYVNRNTNLAKQAASIPNTTVITDPAISNNTVERNIVSNIENKVVIK